MHEVFLSGLRDWKEKLTKEIDEMRELRKEAQERTFHYASLTGGIESRCVTRMQVDRQIELEEARVNRMIARSGGVKK